MKRIAFFAYGLVSYLLSLAVFAYLAGFLENLVVPKSIDGPSDTPGAPIGVALVIDLGLMVLFGLQHSVMARPAFKRLWTRFVPEPIERSTYMLFTNIALVALFLLWQPIDLVIWDVAFPGARAAMWTLYAGGWGIVLLATFLLNHFDLFGLRQVWLHLLGRPCTQLPFKTPLFYARVRHPLYVGWIITFLAAPTMTAGHMLFAATLTACMLIAIRLEERNLVQFHGRAYEEYRRRTPMLVPRLLRRRGPSTNIAADASSAA